MIGGRTPDPDVIMRFLDAPAGSGQERVLREHPELLDDVHQGALAALAAQARERDPAWADLIDRSRGFLAWRRSDPSSPMFPPGGVVATIPPELVNAFLALGQPSPMAAFDEHPELLGEQFGDLLRSMNREAMTVGDPTIVQTTESYLRMIDVYRVAIASLVLGKAIGREVPSAILDGVDAMLAAASWHEAREAIGKHPSLLGEQSDALWLTLLAYACQNGDRNAVGSYFEQRRFLLTSRAFGVDLALAQWSDWVGAVPDELTALLSSAEEYASRAIAAGGTAELRQAGEKCERLLRHPSIETAPAAFWASALMTSAVTTLALDRHEPSPEKRAGAIGLLEAALERLPAPAADRELCLFNLGQALRHRFEESGAVADQRAAAEALCEAANIGTGFSPRRGQIVAVASATLESLADLTGEVEPLDRLVSLRTEDLQLAGPFPAARAECVVHLASALFGRYTRTADDSSLEAAIVVLESEVGTIGEIAARATVLQQLGYVLFRRYMARGEVGDLDRARTILGEAVDAGEPRSALRSVALDHLGCVMQESYRRSGASADLDRAVALGEQAVSELADPRLPGPFPATNLANSLLLRYDLAGDQRDLARAVDICESDTAGDASDSDQLASLVNLGNAFRFLYQRTGDIDELHRAIAYLEGSLQRMAAKSAMRPDAESNLVTALFLRYRLTPRPEDLDRITELSEHVVSEDAGDSPRAAGHLGNLGIAFLLRWQESGDQRDLNTAIELLGQAVDRAAIGSDQALTDAANLAGALVTRSGDNDLDRAVALLEPVVDASAPGTSERIRRLVNLGSAYAARHTVGHNRDDPDRAAAAFREASTTGLVVSPEYALAAARSWSSSAAASSAWCDAAEGADAGLRAMRELFRAQLTRSHKELRLSQGLGLASLAAYAHCRVRRFEDAANALEAGRGLLLREVLERDRADLDALAAIGREDLEQRYRAAAAHWFALAGPTDRDGAWDSLPITGR